jgi:hypothetical protein
MSSYYNSKNSQNNARSRDIYDTKGQRHRSRHSTKRNRIDCDNFDTFNVNALGVRPRLEPENQESVNFTSKPVRKFNRNGGIGKEIRKMGPRRGAGSKNYATYETSVYKEESPSNSKYFRDQETF